MNNKGYLTNHEHILKLTYSYYVIFHKYSFNIHIDGYDLKKKKKKLKQTKGRGEKLQLNTCLFLTAKNS